MVDYMTNCCRKINELHGIISTVCSYYVIYAKGDNRAEVIDWYILIERNDFRMLWLETKT